MPDIRWIGVDPGSKYVGIAISAGPNLAMPLKVLPAKPHPKLLDSLKRLAAQQQATGFIVGLPLNMDGSEGPAAREARAFADELAKFTGLQVELVDERLSSFEAEGRLIEGGLKPSERKMRVHAVAAQLLVEAYLGRVSGQSATDSE